MADKDEHPSKVRVFIEDHTGNKTREARIAADVPVGELLPVIVTALELPVTDPGGRPVTYHLACDEQDIAADATLHEAGVTDGAQLTLVPEMKAGGAVLDWLPTLADPPRAAHRGQPGGETAPPSQLGLGAATSGSSGITDANAFADQRQGALASRMEGGTGLANGHMQDGAPPVVPDVASDREEGRSGSGTRLTRDPTGEKACLNANEYAHALADVLADAAGEICFALLGHWGRGKTYLAALVDRKLPARYGRVWFSAWKYRSRPELWAHLHESFYAAQMHDAWWRRVPRLFRANLHKHGVLPLVVMFVGAGIAAVPLGSLLRLALVLLGAIGAIRGALLFFKQRAPVAATLRRFLAVNRHTEKLGLQAAIGVDLESLVIGWAGRLRWSRVRIVLSAIGYLVGVAALLSGLWLGFNPLPMQPIPRLPWLTWYPPPVVAWTVIAVVAGLSVALPVWLLAAGRDKNRLLLVVDDLDRMPSGEMLEIVESLKLFLENGAMRETVQLFLICEEEALRRALADKYGETTRAVEENLQKLFIAHLRLPPLSPSEQEEVLTHVIGAVDDPAPQVTDAAIDTPAPPGPPPSASGSDSPARVAAPPATAADASEFTDDDRRALRKGLRRLGGANSAWAALGPRAIQSYVLRYKLARRLLVARGARVLPEPLAVLLAERMHAGSDGAPAGSEMIEAVIAEVA